MTLLTGKYTDAIGGMFGGGNSAAEQQQADSSLATQGNGSAYQSNSWGPSSCENDAKSFTRCLDENQGNMQICGWYLEQLVSPCARCRMACIEADGANRKLVNQLPVNIKTIRLSACTWQW